MKTMMKFRRIFVVVSLSFGPIFIVFGTWESPTLMEEIYALAGAVTLSFSLLYMLKTIDSTSAQLEEIKNSVADSAAD